MGSSQVNAIMLDATNLCFPLPRVQELCHDELNISYNHFNILQGNICINIQIYLIDNGIITSKCNNVGRYKFVFSITTRPRTLPRRRILVTIILIFCKVIFSFRLVFI